MIRKKLSYWWSRQICIAGVGLALTGSVRTSAEVIWSIGKQDQSHEEFALFKRFLDYPKQFTEEVIFLIGKSKPAEAWPGVQPGPVDGWAGSKSHPYQIKFVHPQVSGGTYVLRIALVSTHGSQPGSLQITLNGHQRTIRLPGGSGDSALEDPARGRAFTFILPLETDRFQPGENNLTIAATASWVIWDNLRLEHVKTGFGPAVLPDSFNFRKLPLFKRRAGELVQPARFSFALIRPAQNLKAHFRIQDRIVETPLAGKILGVLEQQIDIPQITEPTTIKCEIRDGEDVLCSRSVAVEPDRKWTIHVVPQAHVDIGYTDLQEKAMEVHRGSNDLALDLIDKYPEFVWSIESSYVMEDWIASRPRELFQRFFTLAKQDRIEIEAFYGNLLTGLLSDEEAFRSLYYSKQLSREQGTAFRSATLTDAPSHIWSIPTVLRASGIKYLSMGINQGRAPILRGKLDKRSPVWWQGPDGSRVLAFFHDHYAWAGRVGLTEAWGTSDGSKVDLQQAEDRIPWLLNLYNRPDYPYDSIHLHGAYGDNRPLTEELPRTVRAWNEKYAYPKIVFSTNTDWFAAIEKQYGNQLATVSGDGGAFWEDGAGSSAVETAINRQNQQQALLAEMLLTGLYAQGKISRDYRPDFRKIWHLIMLYDEHTWGAHNSISQPDLPEVKEQFRYKAQFAYDAQKLLQPLLTEARRFLPPPPSQTHAEWRLQGNILNTPHYRIILDIEQGGIQSLVDHDTGRELIDRHSPYRCGQVLYARNEKPPYEISTAKFRQVTVVEDGVKFHFEHEQMPDIQFTLRPGTEEKRLDFQYQVEKIKTYEKEGVYVAFPFVGRQPVIDYAVANAVVRAGRDWLPGACKDWFTLQNWLRVRSDQMDILWISLDAPLINLQDINSNKWLEDLPIENGHVYAYVMNNYWFTNYQAGQGGTLHFRFTLTSAPEITNATAMQTGRDWSSIERAAVERMVSATPAQLIVSGFKRSEDGTGYIVRLRETNGKATPAALRVPALPRLQAAHLANGVEEILKPLPLQHGTIALELRPWEIVTIKVE